MGLEAMQDQVVEEEVRVVSVVECDSLARSSRLTYELGIRSSGEGVIRISGNSGNGMFSEEWVPLAAVVNILRVPVHQEAISSMAFRPLYAGRSINSPSFLMAALRNEEVIVAHPSKRRCYMVSALSAFEERVEQLLGVSGVVDPVAEPPKPASKGSRKKA